MLLVALVGGAVLYGLVFLSGALLPSTGPGVDRSSGPTGITLSTLVRWMQVGLAGLLTLGGILLGARHPDDVDRTWAIGVWVVGGLASVGSLIVAVGQHAAPDLAWRTIEIALGPMLGALVLLLLLLTVERVRLVAPSRAPATERAGWALGASGVVLLDRLLPAEWGLARLLGPAAPLLVLLLVGAGVYGGVLFIGALARLAREDRGIADLD